ncbi:MAG: NADH:flavin oxidoreductase/NADH oxidase [Anaerocolumna sp.]|jgi:2,4-dienoyl-CoA reductase-like NADH-dependent reductase (Old Yellow Enzyme family)|nr:NADH:flavin oxidoreductase/NADH oxidase [Anaerocolumna sp.]
MNEINRAFNCRNIQLNNRLVMPPMATGKSEEDGKISKEIIDYYDEKSKGGYISLIIIEHSFISDEGKASNRQLSIASDDMIEPLKELANTIHKNGSKAVMQMNHAGSAASNEVTGLDIVGPSAIINPRIPNGEMPKELLIDDINGIIQNFRDAAIRIKAAGFDGVEIHSAHGYLLNQFFSPLTNKREDEYGGDVLSRIKIHLEVIKAVREAVGEDFTILLRLGACDYRDGGSSIKDSVIASKKFEEAGVDILDISGGFCGYVNPENKEQGYFSEITEAIKKEVAIPVILTGGITDVAEAERLLKDEKTDLIGVGRAILKDSNWAKNAVDNK